MFAQSLLEVSPSQRLRKGWLTAGSITLQAVVVVCLLLLPLVKPEGLASITHVPVPISWFGSPQPIQAAQQQISSAHGGANTITVPHAFSFLPHAGNNSPDEPATCVICPGAGTGPTGPGLLPFGESQPTMPGPPPAQPHITSRPPRISHWMGGNLISKVQPQYPPIARTAGIQGQVVLQAIVSREGTIESLKVLSGHPLLVRSAIEAVSQWRYRPYYLNGEPIEVETQVTVNFSLDR
jgi:periplasmic protein TonB